MGRIYVTFTMSHSWEGFTSLLNDVISPKCVTVHDKKNHNNMVGFVIIALDINLRYRPIIIIIIID